MINELQVAKRIADGTPESGVLNSPEFAARCVGVTVHGYVRGDELWSIARILDAGANESLLAGA